MALTDATRLANFGSGIGTDSTLDLLNVNATGIVTAATLKVGSAVTVSGGIITATTGAFSGDVSVRNLTGVAATFTGVLTYDDVTNVDSVGIITARSDVSIADKIIHTGDTNTAIRFPAADTFTVETGGSERFRVSSAGRVGIGTDSPGVKLEITDADPYIRLTDTAAVTGYSQIMGTHQGALVLSADESGSVASSHLRFDVDGTERVRIDSSGRLLLGTTTPGTTAADDLTVSTSGDTGITIRSGTSNSGSLIFADGTSGSASYRAGIDYYHSSDHMAFTTNGGNERMRITSGGKVGIDDTSPENTLSIKNIGSFDGDANSFYFGSNFTGTGVNFSGSGKHAQRFFFNNSSSNGYLKYENTGTTGNAGDTITWQERFRITSTGGFHFTNGELIERAKVTAGKLSDNTNIDLENGMVHLFTTQETTTSTPNIRINSSTSLNSVMATGEMISVTLITTAAAGAYSAQLTIDGSAVTENWTGGSAPSDGGSSGVDIHAYTIIKTADATFTVVATQTKTS